MELNPLIFPGKKYKQQKLKWFQQFIIKIPKTQGEIPCFFYESNKPSNKLLIFFHGSTCNIIDQKSLLFYQHFQKALNVMFFRLQLLILSQVHIVAPEYPGYGIYKGHPTAEQIEDDSLIVFDYFNKSLKIPKEQIIVYGSSLGSGPAIFLAQSRNQVGALILKSAFTSLKNVLKRFVSFLNVLVKNRFQNEQRIQKVTCPALFIHGKKDILLSYLHTEKLFEKLGTKVHKYKHIAPEMTHRKYDLNKDILNPMRKFLIERLEKQFKNKQPLLFPKEKMKHLE